MGQPRAPGSAGFTFLTVLFVIVIIGIMLGMTGQWWRMTMQREREEELLFRGQQIRNAIDKWYNPGPGKPPATPLNDLKDLVSNPFTMTKVSYLRRLYLDPMTGKEWVPLRDPRGTRGIIGVASSSEYPPIKKDNFPDELKNFIGKTTYRQWEFSIQLATTPGMSGMSMPGQNPISGGPGGATLEQHPVPGAYAPEQTPGTGNGPMGPTIIIQTFGGNLNPYQSQPSPGR